MSSPIKVATVLQSATILGKRKATSHVDSFVLHLASSPEPSHTDSDFEPLQKFTESPKPSSRAPIIVNGTLVARTKKLYKCTNTGCEKSYSKPSRLAEHERSHTGQRPFVCEVCRKSYLRETHLQAHARSHLPESSRPLACSEADCRKRFWTSQHLRVHVGWHNGTKPFSCPEEECNERFSKHHQLRSHICAIHSAPGTKPYRCEHAGCTKSFSTNQHLRTHIKVHDDKRYTCVHPACLADINTVPTYFPAWTVLQHHIRTAHPPTCTHPSCNSRIFSSQKGLRAHQKLHEQREVEMELDNIIFASECDGTDDGEPPRKKRRGGEVGRDWVCDVDGCKKDFKSKQALLTHNTVTHLGRRDYVCPLETCKRAFGYKHLLQRHMAKGHASAISGSGSYGDFPPSEDGDDVPGAESATLPRKPCSSARLDIDTITGNAYAQRARANAMNARALRCQYPHLEKLHFSTSVDPPAQGGELGSGLIMGPDCEYVFSRAYDLRRHLRAVHGVDADKESVDRWVKELKKDRRQ